MITDGGKVYIKRYLAAQVPAIAQCIAYGLGGKAESVSETSLEFEVGRTDITLTSYDFVEDRVIFKAILPDDFTGQIYEIGLFSQFENPLAGNFASKILASFDSESEEWTRDADATAGFYTVANARLGGDSLSIAPAANTTDSFSLNDILYDLSGNSGSDIFKLAYTVSGTPPTSVFVRLKTDASNYYSVSFQSPAAGYHIDSATKGGAVVTGNPSWENITSIEVGVEASTSAASVDFDGVRIEDTDTVNPEYVLVSRELLATPLEKVEGMTQEIEFSLNVSV